MSIFKRNRIRTFALLFCAVTFTMFLFSFTLWDPSRYFFKNAFRLSDNGFSKGNAAPDGPVGTHIPPVSARLPKGCPCRHCVTELDDDPAFADHFNRSIHPLMTRENSVLSDETYKWWQVRSVPGVCSGDLKCYLVWGLRKMHMQLLKSR